MTGVGDGGPEMGRSLHAVPDIFESTSPALTAGDVSFKELVSIDLIQAKTSGGEDSKYPEREHFLYAAEINGVKHVFWHTEATSSDPNALVVFVKPGLGEIVEEGIGWKHHKQLARKMPEAEIVSHATFGVGPHGAELSLRDLPAHSMLQMAEQELELIREFWGQREVLVVGTSMGTVINHKMGMLNAVSSDPVEIAGIIHYAPAIVDPKRILKDMAIGFLPEMIKDGGKELFGRTRLHHFLGTMAVLAGSKPRARDLLSMGRQGLDLLKGVPQEEVDALLMHYRTGVIVGIDDPVGQIDMWEELNPGMVWPVRGGHGIALKPFQSANKISKTAAEMGIYTGKPVLEVVRD